MEHSLQEETQLKPYNIRHRCFLFAKQVVLFVGRSNYGRIFHSLFDQLVRSACSIGANMVEGVASRTIKDWRHFHTIALKSANETKYWLCLIRDTQQIDKNEINVLLKEAKEISNIIASIIINSERSK